MTHDFVFLDERRKEECRESKKEEKREEGRKDRRKELKIWRIFGKSSIVKECGVEIHIFSVLEIILVLR